MSLLSRGDAVAAVGSAYDRIEALTDDLAEATTALAETQAELSTAVGQHESDAATIANLQAEVDRLQAIIDGGDPDPDPDPDPVPEVRPYAYLGMSAPLTIWDQRVAEVGPVNLEAQRIFRTSLTQTLEPVRAAVQDDHRAAVVSFKVPSWSGVAQGQYDAQLRAIGAGLEEIAGDTGLVFVTLHHEPEGDGNPADWARMLTHGLPLLASAQVKVGPIGNGWWYSATGQGKPDSYISGYLTPELRAVSDFLASDCYSSSSEGSAVKIRRQAEYAARVGFTGLLGVGEFNSDEAPDLTAAMAAAHDNPAYDSGFICVFNSSTGGIGTVLTGARLQAFKDAKASWRG